MNAERWIVLSALGFCVSSNEAPDVGNSCVSYPDCETRTLSAPLGSSLLLPCNFEARGPGSVLWGRTAGPDLVNLTSEGLIKFLDHMYGRVKVFPNQASEGDYSIRIDELQTSDLGCYSCERGQDCRQVQLVAVRGDLSEEEMILIYICSGVALFILVSVVVYCCMKCILCCNRTLYNINNTEGAGTEAGDRAAPEQTGSVPVDQQQRGGGHDNLVYENDDQDPVSQQRDTSCNYCNPIDLPDPDRTQPTTSTIYPNLNKRVDSQQTKQGFHRDLFSRLRQASLSRHYYENQRELSRQQARSTPAGNPHGAAGFEKKKLKKAKKNGELQNPIYNQRLDQPM